MASLEKKKSKNVSVEKKKINLETVKVFSNEVKNEFNKIAWPDKKHTLGSTGVVIVLVMIISFYLGAVDLLLGKLIGLVLK